MVKIYKSVLVGPLESYGPELAKELERRGYTSFSASQHLGFIAHLSRWMLAENISVAELTVPVLEGYLAGRRAAGYVNYRSLKALRPLLELLAPLGVLPVPEEVALGPVEALLDRYRSHLLAERGVTVGTARSYTDAVRPFLTGRLGTDGLDLVSLTGADVTAHVGAVCPGRATGTAKMIVTSLRSLLNFLHVEGLIGGSLTEAVPAVAGWRLTGLPKGLDPAQVRALLASCDRRRATGRRDYAIVLLLLRLGLRAGEVARLSLDDIDWHHGELVVLGKGNRAERLPLPADVGAAITTYLQRGRPSTAQGRTVFVRVKAPHLALTPGGVSNVVFDAGQRAGLGRIHAHRLRHTTASSMLSSGASMAEIGQVLRHRSALSTALYAKVDRQALSVLARPWPGIGDGS
jgi:site-specific recombinase XerD